MTITHGGRVSELLADVPIPRMFRARQSFPRPRIAAAEIASTVASRLSDEAIAERIAPGMKIAITAGSRGIANIDSITKAIADFVKSRGGLPFIVPSMGSHGGATAEGQRAILAGYGISEETMGCPIRSSMETVSLGHSWLGKPVYIDRNAYESDGIIVSCRIKPHNAFRGPYESGICKMMVVGLGKREGAESVHADGMGKMAENLVANAAVVLQKTPILFALASIENAYDETCILEAVAKEHILEREPTLLRKAFAHMPRIIVGKADVLVVDEIGKKYSGTGVDPNITGTFSTEFASGGLEVQRSCMLDLAESSGGNGLGVGLASAITRRLYDKLDSETMYPNCLTSTIITSAMIPLVLANDKEAIQACLRTLNGVDPDKPRVVRIANSLHIEFIMLSEAYYAEVLRGYFPGLEACGEPEEPTFDTEGNLADRTIPLGEGR
ncbi:MAG TPA: lactate racemase domain-containing protein [Rectinemataceae bacterium]|nr:lactate racemase domain-containing protein [Rectinemataceae bacterium]